MELLTTEVKEFINENYNTNESISSFSRKIIERFNLDIKIQDSFRRNLSTYIRKNILKEQNIQTKKPLKLKKSKFYLLTWEQNNSTLHKELWDNIIAYKEFLNAELAVIQGVYKQPSGGITTLRWSKETKPYWDFTRHDIHKYVNILSDINIRPTAVNPLSGLDGISRDKTSILGHPKRQLVCLPTLEKAPHKALLTTMAITLPNYTYSKEGKKGEFAHRYGFVIVEVRDKDVFHVRQVEAAKDGSFIDLIYSVSNGIVSKNVKSRAIVWGDIHVGNVDPKVYTKTLELINSLNIDTSVLHDLADGESVNNHILNNPILQYKRFEDNKDDVFKEIKDIKNFVYKLPTNKNIIVNSNHDDRFDRWINSADWKKDIKNASAYLELAKIALEDRSGKGILMAILESDQDINKKIIALGLSDSYRIKDIECAHHGHIGANGTRGSLQGFRTINVPVIIGHSHSLGCLDYAYSVGTSTYLRLGYNTGASNWAQGHCIIHENGIVQQIIFTRGEFTTFKLK